MWNSISATLSFLLLLILHQYNAECKCVLRITPTNQPLITEKFGSKEILLSNLDTQVDLGENAKIKAFCTAEFNPFNVLIIRNGYRREIAYDILNKHYLSFKCLSNKLYVFEENDNIISEIDENQMITYTQLGCNGSVYSMHESHDKLPNCDDSLSYALGAKLNTPIILAGLCYELDRFNLKYISYKMHEPFKMLEKAQQYYPEGLNSTSQAEALFPIEYFYQFPSQSNITDYIRHEAESNFWLRVARYDLDNIVQTNNSFRQKLDEFKNYFNIIWWSNLRVGNWRCFMDLLEKRAESVKYNIYTGTSSVISVPISNCENGTNLVISYKGNQRIVPQFVWTYLKSISKNVIEDFVIIAYNSPYFENFNKNSTVLCSDMCNEIDWLKPLEASRHTSTLGVIYCCHPDDVVGLLDGFPYNRQPIYSTIPLSEECNKLSFIDSII